MKPFFYSGLLMLLMSITIDAFSAFPEVARFSGQLVNQAQRSGNSANPSHVLSELGLSVSSLGEGWDHPDALRGVVGVRQATFLFRVPPQCRLGHVQQTRGLNGMKIVTYCREPVAGVVQAMVCLRALQHQPCLSEQFVKIQLPTDGKNVSQAGLQWQGHCSRQGLCTGLIKQSSSIITHAKQISAQARSAANVSSAYHLVQTAYRPSTISYLNSFTGKGSNAFLQACMAGARRALDNGVYRSCNGQTEDVFSTGCHTVKVCKAYDDKTVTEHYTQHCSVYSEIKTVHCINEAHVTIVKKPYPQSDHFSGALQRINGNTFRLTVPEKGTLTQAAFELGHYGDQGPFLCHTVYQGFLKSTLVGTYGPIQCGHWMNQLTMANHHLQIKVNSGDVLTFTLDQFVRGDWIDYANEQITILAQHEQKKAVVSWEEDCDDT
jgi:hypothetical protein